MFTDVQKNALKAPLNRENVKTREQSNRSLSYIEGWHAIAEANRIFGFDGWHRTAIEVRCVSERPRKIGRDGRDGWGVSYICHVRIVVGDVLRDGCGSGHGIDVDCGLAHESALKEAETDAMKRALMTFGNQFGLALYDKEQKQVEDVVPEIEPEMIAAAIDKINSFDTAAGLKAWWKASSAFRSKVGLVTGTAAYEEVWASLVMRGKELATQESVNG
jgi:DNA recombination protein Rad52